MICRNPVKTTDNKSVYTLGHTDNIEYSKDQNLTQKISDMDKNISGNGSKIIKLEEFQKTVISTVTDALYPVGSIKITFDETNPANTLPGTQWQLINSGKYVKMGAPGSRTSKSGGVREIDLSHSHKVNMHTHPVGLHTHSIDPHTHTVSGHTLTMDEIPAHKGHVNPNMPHPGDWHNSSNSPGYIFEYHAFSNGNGGKRSNNQACAFDVHYGNEICPRSETLGGGKAHAHSMTSESLTTGNGGVKNTGGSEASTNSKLSTIDIEPEYQTLFFWKRTK